MTGCKKLFICCEKDGGDAECNSFWILFSLGMGKIFWPAAAFLDPTELLLQQHPSVGSYISDGLGYVLDSSK